MHKLVINTFKATVIQIIVALLISCLILSTVSLLFGATIEEAVNLVSYISIGVDESSEEEREETTVDEENQKLINYPKYGEQYATIEISKIDVNLPVYFGDTLEILSKGVGHSSGSYFPGEGGSIIYMGHNSTKVFRRFSELQIGNTIKVTTTYGEYNYEIYDMQIIKETEVDKLPIQKDEEILMVYTCYPFNNIGYATQRYVVYSKLVE